MKKKKKNPEAWWTIKGPGGYLISHFATRRKYAIQDFIRNDLMPMKWHDYRALGFKAVKVFVTEEK